MNDYLQQIGMAFRLERTRQRLSQQKLADLTKVDQGTINSVENAHQATMITTLKKMADALGKPLADFL